MHGHFRTSSYELLGAPWVNKLHIYKFAFFSYFFSRNQRHSLIHWHLVKIKPTDYDSVAFDLEKTRLWESTEL